MTGTSQRLDWNRLVHLLNHSNVCTNTTARDSHRNRKTPLPTGTIQKTLTNRFTTRPGPPQPRRNNASYIRKLPGALRKLLIS